MNRYPLITVVATGALMASALAHAQSYSGKAAAQDPANPQSDEQITARVKDKITADGPGVAPRIAVTTHDGVVTMEGIALTQSYILKALADAASTDGVVHVNNRLTLQ